MKKEYQSMTPLVRPRNETYGLPYRGWVPDISTKNPSLGIKGGVLGSIQQPAEYLGRYAWKYYGGDKKVQALAWKAQKEVPVWAKKKVIHRYYWDKYYAKVQIKKKFNAKASGTKLQESSQLRTYQSKRNYYYSKKSKYWNGFSRCRPNRANRWCRPYRQRY